ncbi:MAG: RIP metalloprotease RseP [Planctomycetales bacterium 4484_113]|nr:MAG: RIP metalloprotease RseP [Planctomycetales bacterium 4484_113]
MVIIIHEAGHMLAAKMCGVPVSDFSVGFGPSLVSWEWHGTRYHISAFPIGGYVKVAGMEPDEPLTPNSFKVRPWWQKVFILAAGALGNFVLAVILIFVLSFIGFPRQAVLVQAVIPGGPAAEAGFEPGDVVYTVNGQRVKDQFTLRRAIMSAEGREMTFVLERRGEKVEKQVIPRSFEYVNAEGQTVPYNEGAPSIGVMHAIVILVLPKVQIVLPNSEAAKAGIKPGDVITAVNDKPVTLGSDLYYLVSGEAGSPSPLKLALSRGGKKLTVELPSGTTINSLGILFASELERLPFLQTVTRALEAVYTTTVLFIQGLGQLATKEGLEMVSGPVGIGAIIAQSAKSGIYTLIQIAMVITLNLGLLNLLPIPALDGGRIVFVALGLVGIRISERKEAMAHTVGLVFLLSLILLITFRDLMGMLRLSLP